MAAVLGMIILVVFVAVAWYISTYNGIKMAGLKLQEALSGIDVALTKRYDTLTKMVDVVKGYKEHEIKLFTEVIRLRSGMTMEERNNANDQMNQLAGQIRVIAENYPELRSAANFEQLQKAIADVEEHLQAARRLYNSNVTSYNAKLVMFPSSIVASGMGVTPAEFFEAEDAKREDVKMEF